MLYCSKTYNLTIIDTSSVPGPDLRNGHRDNTTYFVILCPWRDPSLVCVHNPVCYTNITVCAVWEEDPEHSSHTEEGQGKRNW